MVRLSTATRLKVVILHPQVLPETKILKQAGQAGLPRSGIHGRIASKKLNL